MKVLFVSYFSPPSGGVTIRRLLSLLKHLRKYNVNEILITSKNPRYYAFEEEELIPENVSLYRINEILLNKNKIKLNIKDQINKDSIILKIVRFFYNLVRYPDPQWLWIPRAVREGIKIVREEKPDVVIATQPPSTNLIVGFIISAFAKVLLILDWRDFWACAPYIERVNPFHRLLDILLEKIIIARAVSIWCVTVPMKKMLKKRFPKYKDRFVYIPNGYDEDDFKNAQRTRKDDGIIRLIHTGPITPVRDPSNFLDVLKEIIESGDFKNKIEFHQFGYIHPKFTGLKREFKDIMLVHNYISHNKVLTEIANADVGVCIAGKFSSDIVGFPHKAYEYLRVGLPVLAIAPENENYRWMRKNGLGVQADPDDKGEIRKAVLTVIKGGFTIDQNIISRFEWGYLVKLAYSNIKKIIRRYN